VSFLWQVALTTDGDFAKLTPARNLKSPGVEAMQKSMSMLLTMSLLAVAQGCGESNTARLGQMSAPTDSESSGAITQVAREFLEAIRVGDSAAASSCLTPIAQQVMRQEDMGFDLLANSTATYRVEEVDHITVDEAGVDTVWTELGTDGAPQQEQWTLGLQRVAGQWRIRGIIADMGSDQQPVLMDFENPGQAAAPGNPAVNTAGTSAPGNSVPQQATRPTAQDPFRQ
jgi:hypothetical protein